MNFVYNSLPPTKKMLLCIYSFLLSFSVIAQLPSGFIDAKLQEGYTAPMGIIFSKNGQKMFVWEKKGILWVSNWNGSTYIKQASPVLDISEEVADWRDLGCQSVALDPNFDTNGLIYLFYQVDRHHLLYFGTPQYNSATDEYFNASISRLSRYKVNNNGGNLTADNTSRKVLLGETKSTGVPVLYESHAGGQIIFGTDGTLLVSTGDNASFNTADLGNDIDSYWQQAVNDGIMRSTENVGSFRSQQINSFCGKLLRMDPNTGDGLSSNPYYDAANPRAAKSRVWALGLRNPYRMSFKTGTGSTNPNDANPGTIFIGDVQNGTWEEFHMLEKGGLNCGWPLYEGIEPQFVFLESGATNPEESGSPTFASLCVQAGKANINNPTPSQRRFVHSPPALDWRHLQNIARYPDYTKGPTVSPEIIGSAGAFVTGTPFGGECATSGTFYTGTTFPTKYQNVYFFADYEANWIKAAVVQDNSDHQIQEILDFAPEGYCKGVVDVESCPLDGSIFYVNINTGDIQKISYGGNRPPVAAISADKTTGTSPLTVNFSSNGSNDPEGGTITYDWNFGDGSANATTANPSHTFSSTGTKGFTITLTVRDNQGSTDAKTLVISVNNAAPSVKITNPSNTTKYTLSGSTQYALNATVTDNDPTGMQYAWQVTLRHNSHEHREPVVYQQSPTVQISPVGCNGETYYYFIDVTVTDNGGLIAKDSVKIYPDCNAQNLNITNLTATAQTKAVALNWTNPSLPFDEIMVVAKEGNSFITNPSGTNYVANADYTGNGTLFENGKVVYKGIGNVITVTGLTSDRQYYFRIFTRKGTTWTGGVEASATPTGVIQALGCLKASYFNNPDLLGNPSVERAESSINYDWGEGAPVAGINADNFSVRWEGTVIPSVTGTYIFTVKGDDGIRLWINNQLVLDRWFYQTDLTNLAALNLTQGQNVTIKLEYYEGLVGATAQLLWAEPNQASKVIEFTACPFTPAPPQTLGCLKASYFNNATLLGNPSVERPESAINYEWGVNAPVSGINADNFSVRWEGTVIPPVSGNYIFSVKGDDGIRLWVNNQLVIDRWVYATTTTNTVAVNLTKGQNVPIKLEYFEGVGGATAQLFWTEPNQVRKIIAFTACPIAPLPPPVLVFSPQKCYRFTARHSGKVMEVASNSTANGERVLQNTWGSTKTQVWRIKAIDATYYSILNGNSGKALDVKAASLANGIYLQQYNINGGTNQQFKFDASSGYYYISARHSGKYLDVLDGLTTNATPVVQMDLSGNLNQQWEVAEVGCPAGTLALLASQIYSADGYREVNKGIITWVSNATGTDYFILEKLNKNGIFETLDIVNARPINDILDKNHYSYVDNRTVDGENTYRITLVSYHTPPQYSNLVTLNFKVAIDFALFPNPTSDYVDVDLKPYEDRPVTLTVLDALGREVRFSTVEKAGKTYRIALDGLIKGQYILLIQTSGKRDVTRLFNIIR